MPLPPHADVRPLETHWFILLARLHNISHKAHKSIFIWPRPFREALGGFTTGSPCFLNYAALRHSGRAAFGVSCVGYSFPSTSHIHFSFHKFSISNTCAPPLPPQPGHIQKSCTKSLVRPRAWGACVFACIVCSCRNRAKGVGRAAVPTMAHMSHRWQSLPLLFQARLQLLREAECSPCWLKCITEMIPGPHFSAAGHCVPP